MKILMIGAHQDDNEILGGGIAYKLVQKGHDVRFLSMTNGSGGHHQLSIEETIATRAKESAAVAKFLNITYDLWMDQNDCILMPDLETRRRLIRYIRNYAPDVIISHRPNDYHADHRAAGQLVLDASYLLVVPHECPDAPALRRMPVIMYYEDMFTQPLFRCDSIVDVDDVLDIKMRVMDLHVSQVYEWLPYAKEYDAVPEDKAERFEWLKGMDTTRAYTDEEVCALKQGYAVRFAKTAARFRKELIEKYGEDRGSKIRYAEAFGVCEYGSPMNEDVKKLFDEL